MKLDQAGCLFDGVRRRETLSTFHGEGSTSPIHDLMLEKIQGTRVLTLRLTLGFRYNQFKRRHPRAGIKAALAVLLGTAGIAFAVAPLSAITLPRPQVSMQLITEAVAVPNVGSQLDALANTSLKLNRVGMVRNGDTADSLLRRLGIDDEDAARFLRNDPLGRAVLSGSKNRSVRVTGASGHAGLIKLEELTVISPAKEPQADTHFVRLRIVRENGTLKAAEETVALTKELRFGSAVVQTGLFAAADAARLPESVTEQLADIFEDEVNFRDVRKGDHFSLVWEVLKADGEPVPWDQGSGRLIAARFFTGSKNHEAMWFEEDGKSGTGAYYGFDGRSKTSGFLASPLAFSRVTSGFAMRFHPIQHEWKAHLGIDYAAPIGTPVRAIGNGTVEFAGWQSGYGQVIQIKHDAEHATVYAHLSEMNVKPGQKVTQGEALGAVGMTGWSTGPHLHFEFKIGGKQVDPVTVARSSINSTLSTVAKTRFNELNQTVETQLAAAERSGVTTRTARME